MNQTTIGKTQEPGAAGPLSDDELKQIDAYWRATLYLCVGMIFLKDNPLLKESLKMEHINSTFVLFL